MNIKNAALYGQIATLGVVLAVGCSPKKNIGLSEDNHRNRFFSELNTNSIINYKWYYSESRGRFVTFARVTLSSDMGVSTATSGYSNIIVTTNPSEKSVVADLLLDRAASLLGGTNNIPVWLKADTNTFLSYMEQKTSAYEYDLWLDTNKNVIYFIGTGVTNALPPS
ncbi:MAG TPA: hypothetical protein VJT54_12350 [Verrucomicrobiae bacterium]|nr:hypothetical protein [Verrucomicrobiae bacterium]